MTVPWLSEWEVQLTCLPCAVPQGRENECFREQLKVGGIPHKYQLMKTPSGTEKENNQIQELYD